MISTNQEAEEMKKDLKETNWIVSIKERYVRDIQVASDEYIEEYEETGDVTENYHWFDTEGELIIGTFKGSCLKDVLELASEVNCIDIRSLCAYQLA